LGPQAAPNPFAGANRYRQSAHSCLSARTHLQEQEFLRRSSSGRSRFEVNLQSLLSCGARRESVLAAGRVARVGSLLGFLEVADALLLEGFPDAERHDGGVLEDAPRAQCLGAYEPDSSGAGRWVHGLARQGRIAAERDVERPREKQTRAATEPLQQPIEG